MPKYRVIIEEILPNPLDQKYGNDEEIYNQVLSLESDLDVQKLVVFINSSLTLKKE